MIETLVRHETAISPYAEMQQNLGANVPPFVARLRREGWAHFTKLGFPTTELEEWKSTNVAAIARATFVRPEAANLDPSELERWRLGTAAVEMVFINGRLAKELSRVPAALTGVAIESISSAMSSQPQVLEEHLGRYASSGSQGFVALNAALLEDGALIHLHDGAPALAGPIHILFVTVGRTPVITVPRVLVVAGRDTRATVVEAYVSIGAGKHFTNTVTEIVVGANASIDHYRQQREENEAFHVSTVEVHQLRDSTYDSHVFSLGGAILRNDLNCRLAGEGSQCVLDGLYLPEGSQHVDNHTIIDHQQPHATSVELYKGVLDGKSRGIFDGKIIVRAGAQKTSARQTNKNLILSKDAIADSKPQLEIHADDVKCNHGSTIGQLDEHALFYLQSRGIGSSEARNILTYGFASEIVERVRVPEIADQLQQMLLHRLPQRMISQEQA